MYVYVWKYSHTYKYTTMCTVCGAHVYVRMYVWCDEFNTECLFAILCPSPSSG